MQTALIALCAYLLGSVSFALLVSRLMGLPDPRSYGSKSLGATNVLRSGSKVAAALTLVGDVGKGALAVVLTALYEGEPALASLDAAMAGALAFLGHLYPVYHGFKGGKGVATAVGVLLAIDPWLGLAPLGTFAVIIVFFRMVSLASVIAAAFAIFWSFWLFGLRPVTGVVAAMALLILWKHRANIQRIASGAEPHLWGKKAGEKKA